MKRRNKWIAGVFCVLLMLVQMSQAVMAAEGSLLVYSRLNSVQYDLYYVAARQADQTWAAANPFDGYAVEVNDGSLGDAALTLAAYVARDGLTPADTQQSVSGTAHFSGLQDGLYLVVGKPVTVDGVRYTPVPFLTELTQGEQVANVKFDEETPADTITVTARKVWAGTDGKHPASVTVQLLCDGAATQEAVLSVGNNWTCTWSGLDGQSVWQVVEKTVPEDYTVTVRQNGTEFVITNTCTRTDPTLPQTGQLWWPVPVLLLSGLVLLVCGFRCRRKERYEP